MKTALLVAFDLLLNAIFSFWIAAAVVALAVGAFRVGPGRAARVLWSIPFVKTLWDAAHGIPADAFFWARIEGTRQQLGSFFAGAGLHYVVPHLRFALAAHTDRGQLRSTVADPTDRRRGGFRRAAKSCLMVHRCRASGGSR